MSIFLPFRTKPRGASFAASLFFIRFIANNWPGAHFSYFSIRYEANDFIYIFWNCISFDVFFSISLFFSHIFVAAAAAVCVTLSSSSIFSSSVNILLLLLHLRNWMPANAHDIDAREQQTRCIARQNTSTGV